MFYLVVFSNIGLADYEKSAKASQTIGLVDNTMITVVVHRYQATITWRRAWGQRQALVEYCA